MLSLKISGKEFKSYMKKQIAFISDIHSNINALTSVLTDITNKGITDIYCVGDSIGYHTRPNEVLNLLQEKEIPSVLGNHDAVIAFYDESLPSTKDGFITPGKWTSDRLSASNRTYLQSLPLDLSLDFAGKKIQICHGSPESISQYIYQKDTDLQQHIAKNLSADILIFGHTHDAYSTIVNGKLFVNAGSVGRMKDGDNRACYTILSIGSDVEVSFVRVDYDYESLAKEIEASGLPTSFAEVVRTGIA